MRKPTKQALENLVEELKSTIAEQTGIIDRLILEKDSLEHSLMNKFGENANYRRVQELELENQNLKEELDWMRKNPLEDEVNKRNATIARLVEKYFFKDDEF